MATETKGKAKTPFNHNRDIKCFRCLKRTYSFQYSNKRVIVMRKYGEIESESRGRMPPFGDCSDVKYPVD